MCMQINYYHSMLNCLLLASARALSRARSVSIMDALSDALFNLGVF